METAVGEVRRRNEQKNLKRFLDHNSNEEPYRNSRNFSYAIGRLFSLLPILPTGLIDNDESMMYMFIRRCALYLI